VTENKPPNIDTFSDDAAATVEMWDEMKQAAGHRGFWQARQLRAQRI